MPAADHSHDRHPQAEVAAAVRPVADLSSPPLLPWLLRDPLDQHTKARSRTALSPLVLSQIRPVGSKNRKQVPGMRTRHTYVTIGAHSCRLGSCPYAASTRTPATILKARGLCSHHGHILVALHSGFRFDGFVRLLGPHDVRRRSSTLRWLCRAGA